AGRHLAQGERVAGTDICPGPGLDLISNRNCGGREDVALGAIGVMEKGDVAAAVGVVLDRRDIRGHAVAQALEIDLAVAPLCATAPVASGDAPVHVATPRFAQA